MKNSILRFMMLGLFIASLTSCTPELVNQLTSPGAGENKYYSGTVSGSGYADYKVYVMAGQILHVSMNSKSGDLFFNVLPPGSNSAIYNSSVSGDNNYHGSINNTGTYIVRVYLMGAAKSQNMVANFGLTIGLDRHNMAYEGKPLKASHDEYGNLRGADGSTPKTCSYAVIRSNGRAEVHVTMPGKSSHVFVYSQGQWVCKSYNCNLTFAKIDANEWELICSGTEKYYIPNSILY